MTSEKHTKNNNKNNKNNNIYVPKTGASSRSKIFLIFYPSFENSTTHIAIVCTLCTFIYQRYNLHEYPMKKSEF